MTSEILNITSQTLIPIGAVGIITGGTFWLTKISMKVKNNSKQLHNIGRIYEKLDKINQRLAMIEGMLTKGNK